MNVIKVMAKEAFAGVVVDIENTDSEMRAYEGTREHTLLPNVISQYRFNKERFLTLAYAWQREWSRAETAPRRGVWLGGPKAAGKTTVIEQFFTRLGVPVLALTCNRRVPLSDYISKMVPDGEGGWMKVPGPLTIAMKEGYPVILNEPSAMDEADLIAMHDVIDRGLLVMEDGEIVKAARGFLVFATDNTMGFGDDTGGYGGVGPMNGATMRRFLKDVVDYPNEEEEVAVLKAYFPKQHEETLAKFVQFAELLRAPNRAGMSSVTMGTGELIDWVEGARYFTPMAQISKTPFNAVWFAFMRVMGGMPAAEMQAARTGFEACFGIDVTGL